MKTFLVTLVMCSLLCLTEVAPATQSHVKKKHRTTHSHIKHRVAESGSRQPIAVYFISFYRETYMAITPDWLKKPVYKQRNLSISESKYLSRELINSGLSGNFNNAISRLLLIYADGTRLLVDRDGNVSVGKANYRLSSDQIRAIDTFLKKRDTLER